MRRLEGLRETQAPRVADLTPTQRTVAVNRLGMGVFRRRFSFDTRQGRLVGSSARVGGPARLGDVGDRRKLRGIPARFAAIAAITLAAVAVVLLLTGGDDDYEVTAEFQNASQLVTGNAVMVGGLQTGTVKSIELGDDGQALVSFTVSDEFAPLPRGTIAAVRQGSLSSVAGRQLQLTLPPSNEGQGEIEDGGALTQAETVSAVDLDEVFNTLDTKTVKDFKAVIKGFRDSYEGVAKQANRGYRYANPFLSTSRRVFAELSRDTRAFEQLIVDTAKLSGLLAARRSDVSALVGNAAGALGAIGRERAALAERDLTAAGVHADREHDLRQPPRGAHRPDRL